MFNTYYKRIGAAILGLFIVAFCALSSAPAAQAAFPTNLTELVDQLMSGQLTPLEMDQLNNYPNGREELKKRLDSKALLTENQVQLLLKYGETRETPTITLEKQRKIDQLPPSVQKDLVIAISAKTGNAPGYQEALKRLPQEVKDEFFSTITNNQSAEAHSTVGDPNDHCNLISTSPEVSGCIRQAIAVIGNIAAYIAGAVLWLSAEAFGFAIRVSIVNFHLFANMDVVRSVWSIGRDLANMFFIFILLYSAIGTLLDIGKASLKQDLTRIIIIAIFINFSMPIARVFIDATNVVAIEVYNKMIPDSLNGNPAWFVVDSLSPQGGVDIKGMITGQPSEGVTPELTTLNAIVSSFGAVIVTLATAFTFLAGAVLLLYRALSLLFIIALSSLAFFSHLIPRADYYSQWWDALINNAIFAPIYMFLLYFVLRVMGESKLETILATASSSGAFSGALATAVYYMILLGLLNGAMMIASKCNIEGASWVNGYVEKARGYVADRARTVSGANFVARQGTAAVQRVASLPGAAAGAVGNFAGRQIVGGIARRFSDSEAMRNFSTGTVRSGDSFLNRTAGRIGSYVGSDTAGSIRNSIEGVGTESFGQSEKTKAAKARIDEFKGDPARQAGVLANMDEVSAQAAYNSLSAEDKIRVEREANAQGNWEVVRKLRTSYEQDKTTAQRGPDAKKVGEIRKATRTVAKEELIARLMGDPAGSGGTYAPADRDGLQRMNNEELGKVLGRVTNPEDVINALRLTQFKSFIINQDNIDSEALRNMLRGMDGRFTQPEFNNFLRGNVAARENLGLPPPPTPPTP